MPPCTRRRRGRHASWLQQAWRSTQQQHCPTCEQHRRTGVRAHLHRDRPPPSWEGARMQSAFMSHVHAACMQHACSRFSPQRPRMHVWLIVSQPRCAGARPGSAPATASGANSHCGTSQRGASAAVIRMRTTPAAGMVTARASRSMSGPSSGAVVSTAVSVAEKRAPVRAQRAA
jgi:hypothetical protein